jgi:hypothetical protein
MVANWTCVLAELRSKALTHGVVIPEQPIADGRWHGCDVAGGNRGAGAYLLFQHLPHVAIYTNRGDSRAPEVWRPDGDRLLPFGNEPHIADALALLAADVALRPTEHLRQPAAVEGVPPASSSSAQSATGGCSPLGDAAREGRSAHFRDPSAGKGRRHLLGKRPPGRSIARHRRDARRLRI